MYDTAHATVSGYTGAQRDERARHTLSNSPGDIWSNIQQLLTLERPLLIEAVTNRTEKEALVAREGAGFKFCKPFCTPPSGSPETLNWVGPAPSRRAGGHRVRLSWAPISDLSQRAHPWTHADTHLLAASSSSPGRAGKDTAAHC